MILPSVPMLEPMGNSPPTAFVPFESFGIGEPRPVKASENTSLDKKTIETTDLPNAVNVENTAKVENTAHSENVPEVQPSDTSKSAEPSALDTNACASTTSFHALATAAAAALANFPDAIDSKPCSAVAAFPTTTTNSRVSHSTRIPLHQIPRGRPSKRGRGSSNRSAGACAKAASTVSTRIVQPVPSVPDFPTQASVSIPAEAKTPPKVVSVPSRFSGEQPPPKPCVVVGKPEVVCVVHIKSPSSFYVHRDQDKPILEDLQKFLDVCPEREHPPLNLVTKGQMYICRFFVDDKWYRVIVKSCTAMLNPPESRDAIVDIFYVDYGNSDRVPLSRLRPLPVELKDVPPYALHCSLFDLHPREGNVWPEDAHRTFCKMVNGVRVHMNVMSFEDDVYRIDLCAIPGMKHCNFPVSMRDAMVFMDLAYLEDESRLNIRQSSARFDSEYLKEEPLSKSEHFLVVLSHIESPSQFYAQRRGTHAEYLSKILDEMSQFYKANKNDMIYDPGVGMPCAAQFSLDKSWYRARVVSIPKKSWVEVFYVDYGNKEEIPYTNIRKMPEKFMRIPPQAIECTLADVMPTKGNSWPTTATKFFLSITKDKELRLLVEDVSKPCTKVILYEEKENVDVCLNALLVKEGHAISIGVGASLVEYFKVEAALPDDSCQGIPIQFETTIKPSRRKVRKTRKVDPGGVGLLTDNEYLPATRSSAKESDSTGPPLSVPVIIVVINSPGCIYVRPCSIEEDIANLIHDMQVYYSGMKICKSEWKEADKCTVWSEKEKKWLRAAILEMLDNTAKVFYKDIAVTEIVPVSNLRVLHETFSKIHDGALRCHMVGIQAAGGHKWSSVACEMLCDLLQKTYSDLFITKKGEIEENSLPIELWARDIVSPGPLEPNRVDWISLNQVLVERGMAIPTTMPETLEIMQAGFYSPSLDSAATTSEIYILEAGDKNQSGSSEECTSSEEDNLSRQELLLCPENPRQQWLPPAPLKMRHFVGMVTNVDSQCVVHLHNIEDSETLAVIKDAVTNFVGDSKPKPQDLYWFEGQMCLVQFFIDKCWYRGKIIKVKANDMYEVLFVDYGNTEICGVKLLRKDVIMTRVPILCRAYQLDEIQPADSDGKWKIEHLDFLHATVDGKNCKVTLKSSTEDEIPKISLTLPGNIDVAQLLVSMHYAIYSSNVMSSYAASEEDMEDVIIENIEEISDIPDSNTENELKDTDEPKILQEKAPESAENTDASFTKVDEISFKKESFVKVVGNQTIMNEAHNESTEVESQQCDNELENKSTIRFSDMFEVSDSSTLPAAKTETGFILSETKPKTESYVDELADGEKSVSKKGNEVDTSAFCQNSVMEENGDEEEEKINRIICEFSNDSNPLLEAIQRTCNPNIEKNVEKTDVAKIVECVSDTVNTKHKSIQGQFSSNDKDYILWSEEVQDLKNEDIQKENFSFRCLNLENCDMLSVQVTILMDSLTEIVMIPERNGNEEIICRDDFDLMTLEIQNEASYLPVIDVPYVGQVCCAQYFEDEQYYRAIIVEVEEGNLKVRVEFVDYGNVEWLDINRVHQIKPTWMNIPVQAIRCQLWNVEIGETCDRRALVKGMSKLVFNQSLSAKIKRKNPLSVELYCGNSTSLVYKPLLDIGLLVEKSEDKSEEQS